MQNQFNNKHLIALLITIAFISAPHAQHLPPIIFAFFCLLLAWRFLTIWKKKWLPNRLWIFLLTLGSMFLLFIQHHTIFGRDAGTSLFITALGLKLMEMRKPKDIILITYLAFIVAASQFLYVQNIFMAFYILIVCSLLVSTLILLHSQTPNLQLAFKQASILLTQALPFMVALFIFFPRLEAPKWLFLNDSHAAKTGLSDTLEPGSISRLGQSDELVFRVKFSGALPPPNERYWRGPVFSHTDGKRWSKINLKNKKDNTSGIKLSGAPYHYTLLQEPQKNNWIFALDIPSKYPSETNINENFQLLASNNPNNRAEYQITSFTSYNTGPINEEEKSANLQLPNSPSEKITSLVTQLQDQSKNPKELIHNLLKFFSEEDFHYTLQPPLMPKKPIEAFLFEHRRGFCSHYATAFVYLMRVANIPARIVTGYQGGKFNKVGQFLEVRQANAHAWAEVWLDQQGWVRIDPTAAVAPERIEQDVNIEMQIASGEVNFLPGHHHSLMRKWLNQAGFMWDSVDYQWQHWIINYTSNKQEGLLEMLGIRQIKTLVYWLIGIFSIFTTLLILSMFFRRKKSNDPVILIYSLFCSKIATKGLIQATGEGAKSFSSRCKQKLPNLAHQIDAITTLYLQLRYGKLNSPHEIEKLKVLVTSFKV